jgi:hypothetical protein
MTIAPLKIFGDEFGDGKDCQLKNVDNFICFIFQTKLHLYRCNKPNNTNYMNFNTKSLDHKFYGKTIRTFTELEGKLFELDLLMSMTFMVSSVSKEQDNNVEKTLNDMGKVRFLICCELLGYSEEMIEIISVGNIMKRIEESDYGFGKYLKDHEENSKLIPKEDMEMIEKLLRNEFSKKEEDVVGQMSDSVRQQPSYMWN